MCDDFRGLAKLRDLPVELHRLFPHSSPTLSFDCLLSIAHQLQSLPSNIVAVGCDTGAGERRCYLEINAVENSTNSIDKGSSRPVVAILYPLRGLGKSSSSGNDRNLFPTTCWMTCDALYAKISKFEEAGWIARFQERLHGSEDFLAQMRGAHRRYSDFRWSLLGEADRAYIAANRWEDAFHRRGIAGMYTADNVKCLHTHAAHFLALPEHGNIVGRWVVEELLKNDLD